MRIGLMIGPERGRYRHKVRQLIADARAAEQAGFSSIWVPHGFASAPSQSPNARPVAAGAASLPRVQTVRRGWEWLAVTGST